MICPQMIGAKAEFCKGDKDLEHQSMMWIMQHMDSESDSYI